MAAGAGRGAAAFLQYITQIEARCLPGRSAAKEHSGQKCCHETEEEDRQVQADVCFGGKSKGRNEGNNYFQQSPREAHAQDSADQRQSEAFSQELSEELSACRPERPARQSLFGERCPAQEGDWPR